jgi:hypothetical protein
VNQRQLTIAIIIVLAIIGAVFLLRRADAAPPVSADRVHAFCVRDFGNDLAVEAYVSKTGADGRIAEDYGGANFTLTGADAKDLRAIRDGAILKSWKKAKGR